MKLAVPLPVLILCSLSACSHPAHEGALGLLDGSCDSILDPLFSSQWHLLNTGQSGGTAGEDTNVVPVWSSGLCGRGIRVAIVDDGLQIRHEDLAANIDGARSYNFLNGGADPTSATAGHGTAMAGLVAARSNELGLRGVHREPSSADTICCRVPARQTKAKR